MKFQIFFFVILSLILSIVQGKTWLRADGNSSNTYNLLNSVLGGTAYEVPDCAHGSYGPHITQRVDTTLNVPIFAFHAHVAEDKEGCSMTGDRQRVEIKTYNPSPNELKGFSGETVTLSWNFRLNSQLQPSTKFFHIHQIKAKGGDDSSPIMTITPRIRSGTNVLEITYTDGNGASPRVIKSDALSIFAGKWVHAREELTYSQNGKYSLVLSRTDNGQQLMAVTENNINLWRNGAEFVRPKWGIYRSLLESNLLRDEHVLFNDFCFAKGTSDKCT
ncbi:unnamed protein product [Orchesella dallaii]|uniref:Uncharacterized protein n=1 Tax=Orchesella dallaii TaxID=48710 RepID=A0ABP1S171_9HEXA